MSETKKLLLTALPVTPEQKQMCIRDSGLPL